jgi:hypothetical protein
MTNKYRIVFYKPGEDTKLYHYRDGEVTPDILRAKDFFNAESAVAHRDYLREQYPTCTVFIEDIHENRIFEREVQAPSPAEDNRSVCFVEPDGFENSGLGFLVRPAIRPAEGFCWCVRPADVPSMKDRATAIESVYGPDPVSTVERAMATWGNLAQPSPAPWASQQDDAQAKRILQEFEKSKRGPGFLRPGDR